MVAQMPAKTIQAPNFVRSAIAPLISATVMIANTAWNATNASGGMPADSPATPPSGAAFIRPFRPTNSKLPMRPLPESSPKASE